MVPVEVSDPPLGEAGVLHGAYAQRPGFNHDYANPEGPFINRLRGVEQAPTSVWEWIQTPTAWRGISGGCISVRTKFYLVRYLGVGAALPVGDRHTDGLPD